MINATWVLVAALLIATSGISHAEPTEADSLLNRMQERYDSTKDYTADFDQETEYRTVNRRVLGKGKVFFSKPAKMLWLELRKPKPQL